MGADEWIAVKGIVWGEEAIIAFGQYDQTKNCIRLYSNLGDNSKTFTAPGWNTGDTTFYAYFNALYATSTEVYPIKKGGGYNGLGESWLTINRDNKMVFGPSDVENENGYQANGFYASIYYAATNTYYTRSIYYTDPIFTRTNLSNAPAKEKHYNVMTNDNYTANKTPQRYERRQAAKQPK